MLVVVWFLVVSLMASSTTADDNSNSTSSDSTFPIPSLLEGHTDPVLTVDDVLQCHNVRTTIRAPDPGVTTEVYLTLKVDRLLSIDDIGETISISASVYFQWAVNSCSANVTAPNATDYERIQVNNTSLIWHPTVMFANSSDDVFMQSTHFGDNMQILFLPSQPNRKLYFYWTRIGVFNSKCGLDLRRFPFDGQTCDFTFVMKEPNEFVKFGGISLTPPNMSPNSQWMLDSTYKEIGLVQSAVIRNGLSSYALAQISFTRNPSYHLFNLLAPCFILISLIFGSFLMPPEKADRPVICCTILLAFVVAQADVLKEVPQTSQRILLAEYILLFTGLSATVTLFDMAMCYLARTHKEAQVDLHVLSLRWFRITAARALDFAGFLLALDFFIIINLYAVLIILP